MYLPLAGELHTRERILGTARQLGAAGLVLAAWNRQPRVKVPNGSVLNTSWLLLSGALKETALQRAGKRREGVGRTAGADGCVSELRGAEQWPPCDGMGMGIGWDAHAGQELCEPPTARIFGISNAHIKVFREKCQAWLDGQFIV